MGLGGLSSQRLVCLFACSFFISRVVGLFLRSWSVGAGVGLRINLLVYKDGSKEFYGSMQYHRTILDGVVPVWINLCPNEMGYHKFSAVQNAF